MRNNKENTNAFLIHISAFAGFLFPFGNIITPLVVWQTLKNRSEFLDKQGKEAINFNISYSLYIFFISILFLPLALGHLFKKNITDIVFNFIFSEVLSFVGISVFYAFVYIIAIVLIITASLKAKEGEYYQYPFTIKFIK